MLRGMRGRHCNSLSDTVLVLKGHSIVMKAREREARVFFFQSDYKIGAFSCGTSIS